MERRSTPGITVPVLPSPSKQQPLPQWTEQSQVMTMAVSRSPTLTATPQSSPLETTPLRGAPVATEWDTNKHQISDFYMDKNMNLNEVVERMKAYDFHATPRQYKAQFARWGWSKYNCKRMRTDLSSGKAVVKSQGKSCYRVKRRRASKTDPAKSLVKTTESSVTLTKSPPPTSPSTTPGIPGEATEIIRSPYTHRNPPSMVQHIDHLNDTARCIQSVLTDIRSHVCEVISLKPDWHQSRTSKIGLISGNDYSSYDHFVLAMDAFLKNEHTSGGEILRQAFLKVEEAIKTDYSCIFYFFFIDLPDLFLQYDRHDILNILLGHIKRLTSAVGLRDRIPGTGLAGLHHLVETDPASLRHYISAASGLWCDLLTELRGPRDRSTLLARRNCLRHDRGADYRHRVRRLCDDYVLLVDEVREQYGEDHDMSSHMEDVSLSVQMSHDFFMDNFVVQNETLISNVEAKYRVTLAPPLTSGSDTTFGRHTPFPSPIQDITDVAEPSNETATVRPLEEWDILDRNIRSNCYHRLSNYFHLQGDLNRSLYYGRSASEGWRGDFWQLKSEMTLVAAGRLFEAEALRRVRLEQQYFGKLPNNCKLLLGLGEVDGPPGPGIGMAAAGGLRT